MVSSSKTVARDLHFHTLYVLFHCYSILMYFFSLLAHVFSGLVPAQFIPLQFIPFSNSPNTVSVFMDYFLNKFPLSLMCSIHCVSILLYVSNHVLVIFTASIRSCISFHNLPPYLPYHLLREAALLCHRPY